MKNLFILILVLISFQTSFADMVPGPGYKKKLAEDKTWKTVKCKDSKNTVVCHFSKLSPDIDECHLLSEKPAEYKFLARVGDVEMYGDEKYCKRTGKDKN